MLQSRNLDDQTYDEIVEYALGRLPWLCPDWTNHNPSDPGITILELMAWYKEMQQYQVNCFTDAMKRKLLLLAGTEPRRAAPARCRFDLTSPEAGGYPALSRLSTPEGVVFELCEAIPAVRPRLSGCYVAAPGGEARDVSELLREDGLGLRPFSFGAGGRTELLLGFSDLPQKELSLWVAAEPAADPPRNPFADDAQAPWTVRWDYEGLGEAAPLSDGTHAMSVSGRIRFEVPEDWEKTQPAGAPEAWYLRASLTDPGCEESARILAIGTGMYAAEQTETWARRLSLTVARRQYCRQLFADALSAQAAFTVFVRTESGWEQTPHEEIADGALRGVRFDSRRAAADGGGNAMIVCTDPIHYYDLFFDSDGLPGMTLRLELNGRQALRSRLELICDTLCRDGSVRPELWRCVDDMSSCGPRDRVFTYDAGDETITFGDGEHGAVVPRGRNAILAASLILSDCALGNIPAGENLRFGDDGAAVRNAAASGGVDEETVESAASRFLAALGATEKCVSAQDYERMAKKTPGLRVAAARAIPGYDPSEPTGRVDRPVMTVVVIPKSMAERPVPDRRFLDTVQRYMDAHRPVCTMVRVVPPKYAGIGVSVQLKVGAPVSEEAVRACLADFLAVRPGGRAIGDGVGRNDVAAVLQKLPGVLRVGRVELSVMGADCRCTAAGDVEVPRTAVAYLKTLNLDLR